MEKQTRSPSFALMKAAKGQKKPKSTSFSDGSSSKTSSKRKSKRGPFSLLKKRNKAGGTRYSRTEELHKYMRKRIIYADSTPSNSTIPEETEQAKKGWWGSCTCFRMEKASSVACTMKYELVPPVDTRSAHTLHYLLDVHTRLVATPEKYEGGWKNMIHYEITNAFKHAHAGLRLLHVANSFCEKALQALSYYLEDGVSQERIELVDGRTVIGSHMIIMVEILKSLVSQNQQDALDIDSFRDMLTRVVAKSSKNSQTISHLVNYFIKAAKNTMRTINRYIQVHDIDYKELQKEAEKSSALKRKARKSIRASIQILSGSWKAKYRELKLYNNADTPLPEMPNKTKVTNDSDTLLKLMAKPVVDAGESQLQREPVAWEEVHNMEAGFKAGTVLRIGAAVEHILHQVNVDLHLASRYLWQFQDGKTYSVTSYAEAILFTKRSLKSLPYGPENRELINPEDRGDILELAKILQDELDLSEYFLMSLRQMVMEVQWSIRLPYEFASSAILPGTLPKYEIVACSDTEKLMELLLREGDLTPILGAGLNKKTVLSLFNASPYRNILKEFPLVLHRMHFTMRLPEDNDKERDSQMQKKEAPATFEPFMAF